MEAETYTDTPRAKRSYKGAAVKIRQIYAKNPDLSKTAIAKMADCTKGNVSTVLKRYLGSSISEAEHRDFADNKADRLEQLQTRIVGSITDEDLKKASLLQKSTAFGILEDKVRTIRGQASSYNVTALLDLVESAKAIRDGRHQALPSDVQADNRGDNPK